MKRKQTAVEWYANEEDKLFTSYQKGFMSTARYILLKYKLREQAKAMHKEEIIKSWMATDNELQRIAAEQYYNETYGGKNE